MSLEQSQWEDVKGNYLKLIKQSLASLDHPRRSEILDNVEKHLESKYAELPANNRTWESFQQIIIEMGPPADYAALLCDDIISAKRSRFGLYQLLSVVFVMVLLIVAAYLISNIEKTPPQTPTVENKVFIISFRPKGSTIFRTHSELLAAFNLNHPKGVRTHHYRTKVQDNQLVGYICVDNEAGVGAIKEMLSKSDTLELLSAAAATPAEFEAHCGLKELSLPAKTNFEERPDKAVTVDNRWHCVDLLDPQKKSSFVSYESFFDSLFKFPSGYESASDAEKTQFLDQWLQDLQSDNYEKATEAAAYLGMVKAKGAAKPLEQMIAAGKGGGRPRWVCTRSLGQIGEKDSIPVLISLLDNQNKNTQVYARVALAEITGVYYGGDKEKWKAWKPGSTAPMQMVPTEAIKPKPDEKVPSTTVTPSQNVAVTPVEEPNSATPVEQGQINVSQMPPIAEPTVLGKWIAVDYVRKSEDFIPDQRQWKKTLILREMQFVPPSTVYWSFNNNIVKQTSFGEFSAETINGRSAKYTIKTIEGQDYLFMDWVTMEVSEQGQSPWCYVLKKEDIESIAETNGQQSVESVSARSDVVDHPNVLGKWASVDFVKTIDQFDPSRRSWGGSFFLTGLDFQSNRHVLFSFNNNTQFKHSWTPGKVDSGESRPALYVVKNISGDVTIRGQKPCYYVLKKTGASPISAGRVSNRKIVVGANYCTIDFVESTLGQASRKEARMLRYPAKGVDFCFSDRGILSEIHLNSGYQGQLETGVSLTSTLQDVFGAYGLPVNTLETADLRKKNDEQILYQKGDTSRIYYGRHRLIFWFRDGVVSQIIVFGREAGLEF